MRNKKILAYTVAGLWLLGLVGLISFVGLIPLPAYGQAEVPFFAQLGVKANVMIVVDSSGSMCWKLGVEGNGCDPIPVRRITMLQRVLSGTNSMPVYDTVTQGSSSATLYQVYEPLYAGEMNLYSDWAIHYGEDTSGFSKFPAITTVSLAAGSTTAIPDVNGTYFVFHDILDPVYLKMANNDYKVDQVFKNATIYFHEYMYKKGYTYITAYSTPKNVYGDGDDNEGTKTGQAKRKRQMYTGGTTGTVTFSNAMLNRWECPPEDVLVYDVRLNSGTYSLDTNNTLPNGQYTPNYFVAFDEVDRGMATTTTLKARHQLSTWMSSSQLNVTQCQVAATGIRINNSDPRYTYNFLRTVYQFITPQTSNRTAANVVTDIQKATHIRLSDAKSHDGTAGPEFIEYYTTSSPASINGAAHIRTILPNLQPTSPTLTIATPNLGGYFSNTANTAPLPLTGNTMMFKGLPITADYLSSSTGLFARFPDIRYGFAQFDSSGNDNDFYTNDSNAPGSGANILANIGQSLQVGSSLLSAASVADKFFNDYNAAASGSALTPIAGALRDLRYYFYNLNGTRLTTPSQFCDWTICTNPLQTNCECKTPIASTTRDHIIMKDPWYNQGADKIGCRRQYVIFLTDGEQTEGLGGTSYPGFLTAQQTAVQNLAKSPTALPLNKGVKVFLIGFGLAGIADARDAMNKMAIASKTDMQDIYADPTTPGRNPFMAQNESQVQDAFNAIMNIIMEGSYTNSAPVIDIQYE